MDKTLYNVAVEVDACATMRDGTILRADIYRPLGDALFPVLLMRLPYEKAFALTNLYAHPEWYASHGYVVVVQDCRGRWRSDGEFIPFVNEVNDGADSVAWASRLSGTTGRVGMYGASYVGATQLQAAIGAGEAVTCMCPAVTLASRYDGYYEGGAFQLAFASYWAMSIVPDIARRKGRADVFRGIAAAMGDPRSSYAHLPVRDFPPLRDTGLAPFFFEWLTHPTHDDYWRDGDIYPLYERIKTPALHIGGWYDTFLTGTLRNYRGISDVGGSGASGRQRLLIGPWIHSPWVRRVGDVDFGPAAESNFVDDLQLRYFNWILKGEDDGIGTEAPVQIFVMGENKWRGEAQWPLERAISTPFYFHSAGQATSLSGDGTLSLAPPDDEPHDVYVYDPRNPSVSRGGHSCCWEAYNPMGPYDQRLVERLRDTLCYSSEVLKEPLEVTGPVSVALWAATDGQDTDWVARLVDVRPDGTAINLAEGILRATYREGFVERKLIVPNQIYEYRIDLRATSNVFRAGHRIRVDIASSSFPHWDRNPNTGRPPCDAGPSDLRTATQCIFHDRARPSHVSLPVVPRGRH